MNFRFVVAAYGAAGVSFLASLVRDYAVINHSSQGQQFFQLLYVVSMAASFGVNAIAQGSGSLRKGSLAVLALIGVGVIFALLSERQATPITLALLVAVLLMWIAGAQWSRTLIERGWVFSGRIRDAITSLLLATLVFAGVSVNPAFAVAVAAGTTFTWIMWQQVRAQLSSPPPGNAQIGGIRDLARSIVLTNAATIMINYWALVQTGQSGEAFGFEMSTVVRFAMYIYQILVVGSIVLISRQSKPLPRAYLHPTIFASLACFVFAWFLPIGIAFVLMPVALTILHYALVLLLQHHIKPLE